MSKRRMIHLYVFLALVIAGLGLPAVVMGDEPSQAGLVIDYGDGRTETLCVGFEGAEIPGSDFLLYAELEVVLDSSGSMGTTVCRVEEVGCSFPAKACFCQCMGGGQCAYWNYYYRDPGSAEWIYSPFGAGLRKVKPGAVDAWVWGDGASPPAQELTYEAICQPDTPTPTQPPATIAPTVTISLPTASLDETPEPTRVPTRTLAATATDMPQETPTPIPTRAEPVTTGLGSPAADADPSPAPEADASQSSTLFTYLPFGLAIVGLVVVGLVVRRRRG